VEESPRGRTGHGVLVVVELYAGGIEEQQLVVVWSQAARQTSAVRHKKKTPTNKE
jgi:hypothetical protein